jgi:hypothetical protein
LARGATKRGREIQWRGWLARLTALVFALQAVGLFLGPAPSAPGAASKSSMSAMSAMADMASPPCPHHSSSHKGHDHGSSDSCPMCQSLGCALAAALPPILVVRADERLIGLLAVPAQHAPPPAWPWRSPPARGPPVIV